MEFDDDNTTGSESMLACPHCLAQFDVYNVLSNGYVCVSCGILSEADEWIED